MMVYLLWAVFALLGFGAGWLVWGRESVGVIEAPTAVGQTTKSRREIRRPKAEALTAHAGPSPFRVVTLDGEVIYDGVSGGEARRHIERLRTYDVEWRAYRSGIAWDWGPKPVDRV